MIEEFRLFLSVCDLGSLSAAARRAHTTPSTVSRRIAALEDRLQVRLFRKSTRRLSLTSAGRALVEGAQPLIDRYDALRADLAETENAPSGLIRISASPGFGGKYIAPLIGEFRHIHPSIDVELELENRTADLIADETDIAIRVGALPDSEMRHLLLGPIHRVACASPGYLRQRSLPRDPSQLGGHDCILVAPSGRRDAVWRFGGGRTHKVGSGVMVSSHDAAVAAAKGNAGIAFLPFWLIRDELEGGSLVRLFPAYNAPGKGGVHLLWQDRPPARVRAFVDFVRERIRPSDLSPG